jgi:hypothetical protein
VRDVQTLAPSSEIDALAVDGETAIVLTSGEPTRAALG